MRQPRGRAKDRLYARLLPYWEWLDNRIQGALYGTGSSYSLGYARTISERDIQAAISKGQHPKQEEQNEILRMVQKEQDRVQHWTSDSGDVAELDHPPHYTRNGVEAWDAMESMARTSDEFIFYLLCSAFKYIWRAQHKGEFEKDVGKSIRFLNKALGVHRKSKYQEQYERSAKNWAV